MSWKETCVMNERMKLMGDWLSGDYCVSELAELYGVSRKTVYKWIGRYEAEGVEGLLDRSKAPHHQANAVSEAVEGMVLELKARHPLWGAPKIRVKLLERIEERCPAESTVSAILKRHGLSRVARRRLRSVPSEQPFGQCEGANQVWCADFKGWFRTGDGSKCMPLTISDAHTRYLLRCQVLGEKTGTRFVKPLFIEAFREFGLPMAMRTDNGTPFACCSLGGLTELSIWWIELGIKLERIEPGKPQQNGRHERMHRTLKEATASPPKRTVREQQTAFDGFRREYNEERPHESLDQRPPGAVYRRSEREYSERKPKEHEYPADWEKRQVKKWGQMKWAGKEIQISKALKGHVIGLKPIDDGKWEVCFRDYKLGVFDEKEGRIKGYKRLQTAMDQNNETSPKV